MATVPPRSPLSRVQIVLIALAALIELGWWWSRTKFRLQAAIPWTLRRRFGWRPH